MPTESVRCLVEVTGSVMPPEVQMLAPCGEVGPHDPHGLGDAPCFGVGTQPTGWQRPRPEAELTKQWALTSAEYRSWDGVDVPSRLQEWAAPALAYAAELMATPQRVNHVAVNWIWL